MPDNAFILKAKTALNRDKPFAGKWQGFECREITGQQVWWGGISSGGSEDFAKAVKKHLGFEAPGPRAFAEGQSAGGKFRIVTAGERQFFVMGGNDLPAGLENAACITNQSDGWVGISVEGPRSREVLEKLATIDLHPSVFPAGSAARAPFEHMLAVIACEDADAGRFAIHFQRSSARSFIDHLCHAAASACGPSLSGGH